MTLQRLMNTMTLNSLPANRRVRIFPNLRNRFGAYIRGDDIEVVSQEHENVVFKFRWVQMADAFNTEAGGAVVTWTLEVFNASSTALTTVVLRVNKRHSVEDGGTTTAVTLGVNSNNTLGDYTPTAIEVPGRYQAPTFVVGSADAPSNDTYKNVSNLAFLQNNVTPVYGLDAAIAAAMAAGAGKIYVRRGSYLSNTPAGFVLPDGVEIEGEGRDTIISFAQALTGPFLTLGNNCKLRNLFFNINVAPAGAVAVIEVAGDDCVLENLRGEESATGGTLVNVINVAGTGDRCKIRNVEMGITAPIDVAALAIASGRCKVESCLFATTTAIVATNAVIVTGNQNTFDDVEITSTDTTVGVTTRTSILNVTGLNNRFLNMRVVSLEIGPCLAETGDHNHVRDSIFSITALPTAGTSIVAAAGTFFSLSHSEVNQGAGIADGTLTQLINIAGVGSKLDHLTVQSEETRALNVAARSCKVRDCSLTVGTTVASTEIVAIAAAGDYCCMENIDLGADAVGALTAGVRCLGTYGKLSKLDMTLAADLSLVVLTGADFTKLCDSQLNSTGATPTVQVVDSPFAKVVENHITNLGAGYGLVLAGGAAGDVPGYRAVENVIASATGGGIQLLNGTLITDTLSAAYILDNIIAFGGTGGIMFVDSGAIGPITDCVVRGNTLTVGAAVDTIVIPATFERNKVVENTINMGANNAVSGINTLAADTLINNNNIRGTGTGLGTIGVELAATADRSRCESNQINMGGAIVTGIQLAAACDWCQIIDNNLVLSGAGANIGIDCGAADCKVQGNIINSAGTGAGTSGINLLAGGLRSEVKDNRINMSGAAPDAAIGVNAAAVNAMVCGNQIDVAAVGAVPGIICDAPDTKISGNNIRCAGTGVGCDGIRLGATADRSIVSENGINMPGEVVNGIALAAACNNCAVVNNNIVVPGVGPAVTETGIACADGVLKVSIIGNNVLQGLGTGINPGGNATTGVIEGNCTNATGTPIGAGNGVYRAAADGGGVYNHVA